MWLVINQSPKVPPFHPGRRTTSTMKYWIHTAVPGLQQHPGISRIHLLSQPPIILSGLKIGNWEYWWCFVCWDIMGHLTNLNSCIGKCSLCIIYIYCRMVKACSTPYCRVVDMRLGKWVDKEVKWCKANHVPLLWSSFTRNGWWWIRVNPAISCYIYPHFRIVKPC